MAHVLSAPEVTRCYFEERFDPHFPAMRLRWQDRDGERLWELPEGITLLGPAPESFGVSLERKARDAYRVRLLWDRSLFLWETLSRAQILTCSITPILRALGTDPWEMLEQPVDGEMHATRPLAA